MGEIYFNYPGRYHPVDFYGDLTFVQDDLTFVQDIPYYLWRLGVNLNDHNFAIAA